MTESNKNTLLSQKRLKEVLNYDAGSGIFTWKVRLANCIRLGMVAGKTDVAGYRVITIDKKNHKAHRLVWLYVYGSFPEIVIDHINGVKSDNRLENLRPATLFENRQNQAMARNNTSGYKGVYWDKNICKWKAALRLNGVRVLGPCGQGSNPVPPCQPGQQPI